MTRETTKFTTAKGTEIEVYTYLTGRESKELQGVFLEGVQVSNVQGETAALSNFGADRVLKAQEVLIRLMTVSVDGDKNDCLNRVLDLPSDDYTFVVEKLNEITGTWGKKK